MSGDPLRPSSPAIIRSIERGIRHHLGLEHEVGLPAAVLHLRLVADGHGAGLVAVTDILHRLVDAGSVQRVQRGELSYYIWLGPIPTRGHSWRLRMVEPDPDHVPPPAADAVVAPVMRDVGIPMRVPMPRGLAYRLAVPAQPIHETWDGEAGSQRRSDRSLYVVDGILVSVMIGSAFIAAGCSVVAWACGL